MKESDTMVDSHRAEVPLSTPESFSFPYDLPYEIQTILMKVSPAG